MYFAQKDVDGILQNKAEVIFDEIVNKRVKARLNNDKQYIIDTEEYFKKCLKDYIESVEKKSEANIDKLKKRVAE